MTNKGKNASDAYKNKAVKDIEAMFCEGKGYHTRNHAEKWAEDLARKEDTQPSKKVLAKLAEWNQLDSQQNEIANKKTDICNFFDREGYNFYSRTLTKNEDNESRYLRTETILGGINASKRQFVKDVFASDTIEEVAQVIEESVKYTKEMKEKSK